jgi:hypothetical protein
MAEALATWIGMAWMLVFHADEALFQTGWFIESLATQVLVIFVLRTRRGLALLRPAAFLLAIAGLSVSYLLFARGAKWVFYRLWRPVTAVTAPTIRAQLPLIGRS